MHSSPSKTPMYGIVALHFVHTACLQSPHMSGARNMSKTQEQMWHHVWPLRMLRRSDPVNFAAARARSLMASPRGNSCGLLPSSERSAGCISDMPHDSSTGVLSTCSRFRATASQDQLLLQRLGVANELGIGVAKYLVLRGNSPHAELVLIRWLLVSDHDV